MSDGRMLFNLLGVNNEAIEDRVCLPMAESVENRVGGMHAAAQFALAEMGCIDFLKKQFPAYLEKAVVLVHRAEIKYSRPAVSTLVAFPYFDRVDFERLLASFESKKRVIVPVNVKLKTETGEVTTHAIYHWYIRLP